MKTIEKFVSQFNARLNLDKSLIVEKRDRCFLLNENLKRSITKNFFYAGIYLGKIKNGKLFPSFSLLNMINEQKANKIVVDKKTAWLFICGRDVFKRGIVKKSVSKKKVAYTLVLNQHGECLGFGRIKQNLDQEKGEVAVKNISDVGDFLRREK